MIEFWLIPINAPVINDKFEKMLILDLIYDNVLIGATFIRVNIMNIGKISIPSIISTTQLWNGAAPVLIIIDVVKIILKFISELVIINNTPNIINDDLILWIIKYFIDDSDDSIVFLIIIGINDINDISIPIQIKNQLFEEIEIIIPNVIM